jgi:hypothetical protein
MLQLFNPFLSSQPISLHLYTRNTVSELRLDKRIFKSKFHVDQFLTYRFQCF